VLLPPQTLPDGDCMAILHDPEGISFGIVQRDAEGISFGIVQRDAA
jgi:predicted enzyme related to lactoylglutathione lyase